MPSKRRKEGVDWISVLVYIAIAFLIAKMLKLIPDPPEENLVNTIAVFAMVSLYGVDALRKRLSGIDSSIDKLTMAIQSLDKRITVLEARIERQ